MNMLAPEMAFRLFFNRHRGDQASRPVLGAVLGIALSMIPLVVVLFMSDGMIRGITDRYIETSTYHLQLRNYDSLPAEELEKVKKSLVGREGMKHVFLEHTGMGMAFTGSGENAVSIRGLDPEIYDRDTGFSRFLEVREGRFFLDRNDAAMIGSETARKLKLQVGDEIKLLTGKTLSTGKYIPKVSRFTVEGIFSTGYQDLDKMWILIPYERSLKILQDNQSRTVIGIKTEDPYGDTSVIEEELNSILKGRWGIYTWNTLNRSQQSNFETTRSLLVFIMVLIVLVAVMNISSSMVMLVMENEQAIGIQKSMGLAPGTLAAQYMMTAGMAGASGSLAGIGAGCFISLYLNQILGFLEAGINGIIHIFNFFISRPTEGHLELLNRAYYLDEIPVEIHMNVIVLIFLFTVLLSVGASFIPAGKAARIKPLDILRKH